MSTQRYVYQSGQSLPVDFLFMILFPLALPWLAYLLARHRRHKLIGGRWFTLLRTLGYHVGLRTTKNELADWRDPTGWQQWNWPAIASDCECRDCRDHRRRSRGIGDE